MVDLKNGDTIKCHDKDELIELMNELARVGIETDFNYDDGLRLEIIKINK